MSKKVLREGPISPTMIGEVIAKHESKTYLGAHQIFLGSVRADAVDSKEVTAIDYSAYEDMAEAEFSKIREEIFDQYDLGCMHVYHSLGEVKVGEISLVVMISASHRVGLAEAVTQMVELIKEKD